MAAGAFSDSPDARGSLNRGIVTYAFARSQGKAARRMRPARKRTLLSGEPDSFQLPQFRRIRDLTE